MDRENVIKELHEARRYLEDKEWSDRGASPHIDAINNALVLLKEQDAKEHISDCFEPWDVLWKAPDGTFKGRCDNCGFVHVFIEGHVTQYKFCPQCGEQKQEL